MISHLQHLAATLRARMMQKPCLIFPLLAVGMDSPSRRTEAAFAMAAQYKYALAMWQFRKQSVTHPLQHIFWPQGFLRFSHDSSLTNWGAGSAKRTLENQNLGYTSRGGKKWQNWAQAVSSLIAEISGGPVTTRTGAAQHETQMRAVTLGLHRKPYYPRIQSLLLPGSR